jgi:diadenylate cyclase
MLRLVPDKVNVVGGSLAIKEIMTIYTEKIPLEGITTSGTATVGLVLHPSSLKLDNATRNRIEVIYKVRRRPAAAP